MKDVKRVPIKKKKVDSSRWTGMTPQKGGNNKVVLISLLIIAALVVGIFNADKVTTYLTGDELAARVNGNAIYMSEVDEEYDKVPSFYKNMFSKRTILDQIISQEVLLQEAKRQGMDISDEEMDEKIDKAIQDSGKTRQEFIDILQKQNSSLEELKDYYKLSLLIDKLIREEVIAKINVTDEQVENYYEANKEEFYVNQTEVKASHILLSTQDRENESAYELAKNIRQRVLDGENFTELAINYSDDPSVANNQGDLGYFPKGVMVESFEDVVFDMEIGEVSDLVESKYGYHIIFKQGEREPGYLPLEEVRDKVEKKILQSKQQEAVSNYVQALREQSDIRYLGEFKNETQPSVEIMDSGEVESDTEDEIVVESEDDLETDSSDDVVDDEVENLTAEVEELDEEMQDNQETQQEVDDMTSDNETSNSTVA